MDIRGGELHMDDAHIAIVFHTVIIGIVGGIIRWLRRKGPHNWWQLFVSVITSGFVGLMSHYATSWLELDYHLQFFISGIAGYGGGVLLDDAVEWLREWMRGKGK